MALSNEIKNEFIARRGLGESYHAISVKLNVSEKTLKIWGGKYAEDIRSAESKGLEVAIDLHNLGRSGRLQAVANEIERIDAELVKRDLSSVPVSKLVMLKLAALELAGKIIGNTDSKKDESTLSPWEVMRNFLSGDLPEDDEIRIENQKKDEEIVKLRMLHYGGSADFSDEK